MFIKFNLGTIPIRGEIVPKRKSLTLSLDVPPRAKNVKSIARGDLGTIHTLPT